VKHLGIATLLFPSPGEGCSVPPICRWVSGAKRTLWGRRNRIRPPLERREEFKRVTEVRFDPLTAATTARIYDRRYLCSRL
jgi:hypothetical protein